MIVDETNWYTIDKFDRLRGNAIVDAAEREAHAEAAMKEAKAQTEKFNKSIGSVLEGEYAETPEFFVSPTCEKTPNPKHDYCSNYMEKFHVGGIIK